MERRLSVALAGIGFVGALLMTVVGNRRAAPSAEVEAAAADVDALVRETAAGVQARADTLSQLPRLGWIVATDAATVGDLSADELEFRPHAGEQIELAQVRRSDGQIRVLRRLPAGSAAPLPLSRPGSHLLVSGGRILVVTVVGIQPRLRVNEIRGTLAVAKAVDPTPIVRRLEATGVNARLQVGGGLVPLGRGAAVAGGGAATVALKSDVAEGAVLIGSRGRSTWWTRIAPLLLLALTFGGGGVLWRRGAGQPSAPRASRLDARLPASPARAVAALAFAPPRARVATPTDAIPLDDSVLDGDLTYDPDATVLADPASSPPPAVTRSRTGSVPIVLSGPRPPPQRTKTPVALAHEADPATQEYRALFLEFVTLRRTCGEPVDSLDREQFVETLREARARLIKDDTVNDVRFRLAFANGKAVIRFTTVP